MHRHLRLLYRGRIATHYMKSMRPSGHPASNFHSTPDGFVPSSMAPRMTRIPVYVHRDAAATEGLKTPTRRKRHSSVERRTRTRTISGTSTMRPCGPTDSPRNPFGRQYKWHCLRRLPPPLNPFLSHLPLVFTLVRARSSANEPPVYRKVHVPRNYTITHLRALLIFLFDATMYDGDLFSSLHHVVEICKDADIPGNLWSAETCIKLSGVQDPYSPARDDGPELGDADEPEVSRTGSYRWEGEGDFIIDSIWPTTRFQDDEWESQNECRGIIFVSGVLLYIPCPKYLSSRRTSGAIHTSRCTLPTSRRADRKPPTRWTPPSLSRAAGSRTPSPLAHLPPPAARRQAPAGTNPTPSRNST